MQANLDRYKDILSQYYVTSPIDGIVTNLPVRVGETVVPGVQNSAASTIMTIADMSLITAEVKVDETDIVNVQLGPGGRGDHRRHAQPDVPWARDRDRQHGDSAVHRRGCVAEQYFRSGSQGFQSSGGVGRSAGGDPARTVVHRQDHHRDPAERADDSDPGADGAQGRPGSGEKERQRRSRTAIRRTEKARKEELQGVFVVRNGKAEFPR